jgi:rod shape-determining protein MreC
MIKRLYDIVLQFREYALLAILLALSIALLAFNDTRQLRSIRSTTVSTVGFLQDVFNVIPNYLRLSHENQVLRDLNVSLSDEVSRLREAKLENLRLRGMLELKEKGAFRYRGATVVGKTLQMMRNTITLDAGDNDGVRINMPLVTEQGLVGKILFCSPTYSVGQILFNKDIRVSAKVQRSRVDGIIRWDGGRTLAMYNVAKTLDVRPGDAVITSDYSSIFPPGIRIGTVAEAREVTGSLFQTIAIEPSVDFATLEEAFIVLVAPDSNRVVLDRRVRDYAGPQ